MAELAVLAVAIDVVQVVKDVSNECLERIRAARNLGALGERYAETTSQVHSHFRAMMGLYHILVLCSCLHLPQRCEVAE